MITVSIAGAKAGFFDREKVQKSVDKANRKALSKFGAFVRTRSRSSIRKSKNVSKPGNPPRSHVGLLRRLILFSYDRGRKSVVIGPAKLNKPSPYLVPPLLEYGGTVPGNNRVIWVTNEVGRNKTTGRFQSSGKTRVELKGNVRYRPRPFMEPAFKVEVAKAEQLWRDSVR